MYQVLAYINYWLRQVDAHSLHSPFLFDLYKELIESPFKTDQSIESLRKEIKNSKEEIELLDLGVGSRITKEKKRKISTIVRHSATPFKFSIFLQKLIKHYQLDHVIELGSTLGLNTCYMAKSAKQVTTFEVDPQMAEMAQSHFDRLSFDNINLIQGDIDHTLLSSLSEIEHIDLAYIDAKHRFEPTLRYFNSLCPKMSTNGVLVFDDIHWSKEMNKAWKEICRDERSRLTIDLFEAGLVFLDQKLPNEHLILKF